MDSSKNKTQRTTRGQRGMSLTEVVVTTAIFAVIFIVALTLYDQGNKVFKTSVESADMQQNTRAGFDRLVSDLRMAGYDADRDGVPSRAPSGPWAPSTVYAPGAIVSPTVSNGFSYRAVSGGQTGNLEPTWPLVAGQVHTGDGSVTWVTLGPVFQQPDEQIEFAGRSAITIRANFDYQIDTTREHGREGAFMSDVNNPNYEPAGGQFPIVTTANNEIVTYALRSVSGPNPDTLEFWADTTTPRSVFPGGSAERRVQIPNVDLCLSGCNNPPYTLMRFTLGPGGANSGGVPDAGTPVANNIRDLQFFYYSDTAGEVENLIEDQSGGVFTPVPPNGAIGGEGRYNPAAIGADPEWGDRTQRASIQTVRVRLVGMNNKPDPKYTNPAEVGTPAENYRTYTLESNVSPRNLGLSGLSEPDTNPPSAPFITSVCTGACRVTRVQWNPSVTGNVDSYQVRWDLDSGGDYDNIGIVVPGDVVSAPVFNLTPGVPHYFKVVAVNEIGSSRLEDSFARRGTPVNSTRPNPVTTLTATEGAAALANQILLTWTAPSRNDPALDNLSCDPNPVSGELIDPAEPIRYRVWRGTSEDFNPAATPSEGEIVLDNGVAAQPNGPGGSIITWTDDKTNALGKPPANCKNYWYRVQVYDTCSLDASPANNPDDPSTGQSSIFPRAEAGGTDPAIHGYASSTTRPAAPAAPTIDYSGTYSRCSGNICSVRIKIPKVTSDTSNPTQIITVDQYRVRRERKKATDTTWVSDTVLALLTDASSDPANMDGNFVIYTDGTAIDKDPNDRRKWYYRYTVTALQCGAESDPSPPVQFPESCGLAGSTVIESGASSGDGSAAAPWVMAANDFLQVTPPDGILLNRVLYETYPEPDPNPNNPPIDTYDAPDAPYQYNWSNQADGQVYRVVITLTNDQGCTEQTERYIQDDPINCPSATVTQVGSTGGSGQGTVGLPWIMNAGDTVTVNPPAAGPVDSVVFELFRTPGNSSADGPYTILAGDPFVYTWRDLTDNETYRLNIIINYTDGCIENIDRYITDEPPPVCSGATTVVTGAVSGDGLAQGSPWVLNGGDSIEIVPPAGGVVNQVVFTITPVSPAGTALPPVTDSFAPYTLPWSDLTDGTIYQVDAVITYSPSACSPETITRFVRDEKCSGAVAAQIGSSGAGLGLTTASPWVFDANDTVSVQAPVGATITNVTFNLFDQPGTTRIFTISDATSPYEFVWTNRTDDALYRLEIVITYTPGCTETLTRYIRDEGTCFLTATATSVLTVDSGSRKIATITYQITNPSVQVVTMSGIKVDWLRDSQHPEAVLQEIVYNGSVTDTVTNQAPPTTGVMTPITPTPPTIPATSSSYTIALKYDIGPRSGSNAVGDLGANWVTGLCLQYTVPSFGGTPASCNVSGSISGNPGNCS
jgi:prepilin-type N-terminal cleavage/methylation domain-containing protein